MGYTHYWTRTKLTGAKMLTVGENVRKIIAEIDGKTTNTAGGYYSKCPVKISGADGTGQPSISETEIMLNGRGPELDHETFVITPNEGGDFCKTARKPYDVVVTACLTFLAADYGYEVGSDGDVEDWEAGVELAEKALGRPFANPLVVEQLVGRG